MTSVKNITSLARKWQKMDAMGRKTISSPGTNNEVVDVDGYNKSRVAQKGHFVVYTTDNKRFEFPLVYLENNLFKELLELSEEEFGLSSDGPITFPCDGVFMDCIVSLIKHGGAKGLEKDFLISIATSHCTFSDTFHHTSTGQHSVVCGY